MRKCIKCQNLEVRRKTCSKCSGTTEPFQPGEAEVALADKVVKLDNQPKDPPAPVIAAANDTYERAEQFLNAMRFPLGYLGDSSKSLRGVVQNGGAKFYFEKVFYNENAQWCREMFRMLEQHLNGMIRMVVKDNKPNYYRYSAEFVQGQGLIVKGVKLNK